MTGQGPYPTSAGVEAAIKAAATRASRDNPSVTIRDRIQQTHFDRFLCRIFSTGADSGWILKGGAGILARVPNTRTTLDVDLYRSQITLDDALDEVRRLASLDLDDHFRFVYSGHTPLLVEDGQPYLDGYRVTFDTYIGVKASSRIKIDLTVGREPTAPVVIADPANRLVLPRLKSVPYCLYPVVDQIADKVCATMATYRSRPSSREKDALHMVVLANTHDVDADALVRAIETQRRMRGIAAFGGFVIPASWGPAYQKMARDDPHCANARTIDEARILLSRFLDPLLDGSRTAGSWSHESSAWVGESN